MGVLALDTLITLVRLEAYHAMTTDGYDLVDAEYIADAIDRDVTASFVKMAFRQLKSTSELEYETKRNPTGVDMWTGNVFITAKGIRSVEKDLADDQSITATYQRSGIDGASITYASSGFAPASDRIVSFGDNEPDAEKARKAVGALRKKVIESNDLPEQLAPFRETVIDEITALDALIGKTLVRAAFVLSLARKLLPWITEKAGTAAIGELAKKALAALIDWLT